MSVHPIVETESLGPETRPEERKSDLRPGTPESDRGGRPSQQHMGYIRRIL